MTDIKPDLTGKEKGRALVDSWKGQKKAEDEVKEKEVTESLLAVRDNPDLMKMYGEASDMGSENIGGESLPLLKIHSSGKSVSDELANGEEPHNGYFFYKKTQEEFKDVLIHVLTISRGFRADGIEGKTNVFNQILGGVIIGEGELKPFLMYFTGTKLNNLWNFGKEVAKYTKMKPVGIPMFALTVKLSTEKVIDGAKQWFVVKFEISKDSNGNPELITDPAEFTVIRNNVKTVEDMIERLISVKATEDTAQIPKNSGYDSNGNKIVDINFGDEPEEKPLESGEEIPEVLPF